MSPYLLKEASVRYFREISRKSSGPLSAKGIVKSANEMFGYDASGNSLAPGEGGVSMPLDGGMSMPMDGGMSIDPGDSEYSGD